MNASPNQPKINDVSVIPTCAVDRYSVMWLVMLMACVKFDDGLLRASCNARKADGRTLTSEYSVSVNKTANNKITTITTILIIIDGPESIIGLPLL